MTDYRIRLGVVQQVLIAAILIAMAPAAMAAPADSGKADAPKPGEPTEAKARKTFTDAMEWRKRGNRTAAMESYRKANAQDGGHCSECLSRALNLAQDIGAYKEQTEILRDWLPLAKSDKERALLHLHLGTALEFEGIAEKKPKYFTASCDELKTALQLAPQLSAAHFVMGVSLAWLHQDDQAHAEFETFLKEDHDHSSVHQRAERYLERVELARSKMAPPFSVTTIDGQRVSMDNLTGKVVLIDFWATWCGPCREALPHIRQIAHRFEGQPLVVLSISLDSDAAKWKEFVQKNGMTWLQYRDGSFDGPVATLFAVKAIPATFAIDADGVLEDQHVGDADIEGKLKKLVARAAEVANRQPAAPAQSAATGGSQP